LAHICSMPARFYDQNILSKLPHKRKLSAFLNMLINKHIKKLKKIDVTYVFCDDAYLHQMNKEFLSHDTLTDIITFDLSPNNYELEAEIYISIERVRENAATYEVSYKEELHRVIFHGALHLCGYKDKTATDKKKMRAMEEKCLKEYNQ
jgi:probable rRNA maturation factor